jgi:DNA-binding transcriptional MerR regulator
LRLVPTPVVSKLTGLSTETLREWTRRRGLVHADVVPKQKGSPAQFSWQTILVLRIALQLRNSFHVELEAYKTAFLNLQQELRVKSFIELWGKVLTLDSDGTWELASSQSLRVVGDRLLLELDPHLQVLHTGFAITDDEVMREQLDLFSLPNVHRQGGIHSTPLLTRIQKTR